MIDRFSFLIRSASEVNYRIETGGDALVCVAERSQCMWCVGQLFMHKSCTVQAFTTQNTLVTDSDWLVYLSLCSTEKKNCMFEDLLFFFSSFLCYTVDCEEFRFWPHRDTATTLLWYTECKYMFFAEKCLFASVIQGQIAKWNSFTLFCFYQCDKTFTWLVATVSSAGHLKGPSHYTSCFVFLITLDLCYQIVRREKGRLDFCLKVRRRFLPDCNMFLMISN